MSSQFNWGICDDNVVMVKCHVFTLCIYFGNAASSATTFGFHLYRQFLLSCNFSFSLSFRSHFVWFRAHFLDDVEFSWNFSFDSTTNIAIVVVSGSSMFKWQGQENKMKINECIFSLSPNAIFIWLVKPTGDWNNHMPKWEKKYKMKIEFLLLLSIYNSICHYKCLGYVHTDCLIFFVSVWFGG